MSGKVVMIKKVKIKACVSLILNFEFRRWYDIKIGVQKENLAPRFNILLILGLTIDHRMTKWHKCIDHQLEVLQAKRNTDDSTAEYSTQSKVAQLPRLVGRSEG